VRSLRVVRAQFTCVSLGFQ